MGPTLDAPMGEEGLVELTIGPLAGHANQHPVLAARHRPVQGHTHKPAFRLLYTPHQGGAPLGRWDGDVPDRGPVAHIRKHAGTN